ncbi:hypothetical protein HX109_11090 [Galbibacter sp. BG1]|uniref:hypothetical protein n=1 Tax=Galbibacter sp. BG1 TaxID=1170699 RepID=UPI0015C1035E|nr:hypothetical protein [Galbibacter sp. BG1]QLE02073.1 hypothetical protein HX109_11090 [Galbibacter sp. BG1]
MKTIKLFLTVALMAVATTVLANENDPKPTNKAVSEQLSTILGTPAFKVTDKDLLARVHFMVNKDHELIVISVKAENEMVEDYIKSRMNYKKIEKNSLQLGEDYVVDVRIVASK